MGRGVYTDIGNSPTVQLHLHHAARQLPDARWRETGKGGGMIVRDGGQGSGGAFLESLCPGPPQLPERALGGLTVPPATSRRWCRLPSSQEPTWRSFRTPCPYASHYGNRETLVRRQAAEPHLEDSWCRIRRSMYLVSASLCLVVTDRPKVMAALKSLRTPIWLAPIAFDWGASPPLFLRIVATRSHGIVRTDQVAVLPCGIPRQHTYRFSKVKSRI